MMVTFEGNMRKNVTIDIEELQRPQITINLYNDTLQLPDNAVLAISRVVDRCLRLNPRDRPTAVELLDDPFFADAE